MHDLADRLTRLQRLRREGRRLDDQKPCSRRFRLEDDADEPLAAALDLVQRFGG